jgi:hypothetical protein
MEATPVTAVSRRTSNQLARAGVSAAGRGRGGAMETVRFGDVTITAQRPSDADIERNVEAGGAGLARALPRLARAGVRIYPKKDVPLYWCDADDPTVFIRKLNGRTQRGVFEDGQFKATD